MPLHCPFISSPPFPLHLSFMSLAFSLHLPSISHEYLSPSFPVHVPFVSLHFPSLLPPRLENCQCTFWLGKCRAHCSPIPRNSFPLLSLPFPHEACPFNSPLIFLIPLHFPFISPSFLRQFRFSLICLYVPSLLSISLHVPYMPCIAPSFPCTSPSSPLRFQFISLSCPLHVPSFSISFP